MKPEMLLLLWAVVLTFVQMLIAAQGAFMQVGLTTLAGNRDNFPGLTGWAGRAQRAHRNMLENMVLFVALVLLVIAGGKTNQMTVLGAELFLRVVVEFAQERAFEIGIGCFWGWMLIIPDGELLAGKRLVIAFDHGLFLSQFEMTIEPGVKRGAGNGIVIMRKMFATFEHDVIGRAEEFVELF